MSKSCRWCGDLQALQVSPLSGSPCSRAPVLGLLTRFSGLLLVEEERVGEARLHLWDLITDDLHQHLRELHLQSVRLPERVEAEVQKTPHELWDTKLTAVRKHILQAQRKH